MNFKSQNCTHGPVHERKSPHVTSTYLKPVGSIVAASPVLRPAENTNQQALSVTSCTWGDEQLGQMRGSKKKKGGGAKT